MNVVFYKFFAFLVRPLLKIFFPYEVRGKENLKGLSSGSIVCANHLSIMDPIFLIVSYPYPIFFMAKAELFKNNILKILLKLMGAFPVQRGKGDKEAVDYAISIPRQGKTLGIFIEGTRSKSGDFLRPKSGAAVLASKTGSEVVPVCITGSSKDNKIRMFKKTIIHYGNVVQAENIRISDNNRAEIKQATNLIMGNIMNLRREI